MISSGAQQRLLFGGEYTDSLATTRGNVLKKKVVSPSSFVTSARLPQTESAAKLHCDRSYQMMAWMGKAEGVEVTDWGGTCMVITLFQLCQN